MKFGSVSIADAVGGLLARALQVGDARFSVGHRLSSDDVEALRSGGIRTVWMARLDPGDVERSEATRRIAEAVAGDGVRIAADAGRYELFAQERGVWVAEPRGVDAINCMDEAIAFATLPSYRLVEAGQRVATVSLVTLAIPEEPLSAAVSEASANHVRVARLTPRRAGLILSGCNGDDLDAVAKAERGRFGALGCSLQPEIRCAHEPGPVAEAMRSLVDEGAHPIIVMSSTPTVDRDDVVPRALEESGGLVEHFGVPNDPAAAFVFGQHGKASVLGVPLPACPDGVYQDVLQRIVAGLPVTSEVLMRLGCGGLADRDEP